MFILHLNNIQQAYMPNSVRQDFHTVMAIV